MAEFASKGVAGSGLGLGIAGTALGLLNNGGNGLLGGLLGGGNQNVVSALQAENSMLKAENYSDKNANTIVPMSAICPTPMAKYNAWVAPTNTPATGA